MGCTNSKAAATAAAAVVGERNAQSAQHDLGRAEHDHEQGAPPIELTEHNVFRIGKEALLLDESGTSQQKSEDYAWIDGSGSRPTKEKAGVVDQSSDAAAADSHQQKAAANTAAAGSVDRSLVDTDELSLDGSISEQTPEQQSAYAVAEDLIASIQRELANSKNVAAAAAAAAAAKAAEDKLQAAAAAAAEAAAAAADTRAPLGVVPDIDSPSSSTGSGTDAAAAAETTIADTDALARAQYARTFLSASGYALGGARCPVPPPSAPLLALRQSPKALQQQEQQQQQRRQQHSRTQSAPVVLHQFSPRSGMHTLAFTTTAGGAADNVTDAAAEAAPDNTAAAEEHADETATAAVVPAAAVAAASSPRRPPPAPTTADSSSSSSSAQQQRATAAAAAAVFSTPVQARKGSLPSSLDRAPSPFFSGVSEKDGGDGVRTG
jgi:trimeric autotransporter adhesin